MGKLGSDGLKHPHLLQDYSTKNPKPIFELTKTTRVIWECVTCHHEWETRVCDRDNKGTRCPKCAGSIASELNSLQALFPEIAEEYAEDLNLLPATEIIAGSKKKYFWRCIHKHVWSAQADNRTRSGQKCPYCTGRLATKEKNLAVIFPTVAAEFDLEKNFPKKPEDFTPQSEKKVWWKCDAGHEWYHSVVSRTAGRVRKCGFCSGNKTDESNNLMVTHPELAKSYHPTKNTVPISEVRWGSHRKVWWVCEVGGDEHDWKTAVVGRVNGAGCFYCFGSGIDSKNNLAAANPELAKEFDLEANFPLTPTTVRALSSTSIHWKCDKGHTWKASPSARNGQAQTGCPECYVGHTSKVEAALRDEIIRTNTLSNVGITHRNNLPIKFSSKKNIVVDILGEYREQKIVVEYDGYRWHSGALDKIEGTSSKRDVEKTEIMLAAGYVVIRVRETSTKGIELGSLPISHKNLYQLPHDYKNDKRNMTATVTRIKLWLKTR